jgi:hypothetical protein
LRLFWALKWNECHLGPKKSMKYWYVMYYITYQYFFPTITYRYIMYFFRTFKKSTAPYKVHNMGLRYIKNYISPFSPNDHSWAMLN